MECHIIVTNEDDLSPCAFMICQYLSGNKMPITEHSMQDHVVHPKTI